LHNYSISVIRDCVGTLHDGTRLGSQEVVDEDLVVVGVADFADSNTVGILVANLGVVVISPAIATQQ